MSRTIHYSLFSIHRLRFMFLGLLALAVFALGVYVIFFRPQSTEAAWYDDSWAYRQAIPVTSTNGSAQSNVFISFTLDTATLITAGKLQSSCQDIRITDVGGKILNYHIGRTNACNNAATTIDFLTSSFPDGTSTYYVYYGNPSASSQDVGAFSQSQASNYSVGALATAEASPGPVAYWKFDDGTGTNAQDSTSNNLDGTLNNTPTWQTEDQCIAGKCLWFSGTANMNVSKSDDAKLDFAATDNFTVSAWVKRNGASSAINYIMSKHDITDDTEDGGYKLWMDADGDLCFGIDDDITWGPDISACSTNANFDDDKLHLVTGVRSVTDDKIYVYVDGVEKSGGGTSDTTTDTLANSNIFYVGVDRDGTSNEWLGFIDEVKVYPYARSAAQVKTDYASRGSVKGSSVSFGSSVSSGSSLSNGLVGYWKMDEASGNLIDTSGNSNTGTVTGTTVASGRFGNGRTFNGSSDYVSIANAPSLTGTGSHTISAWVQYSSNPTAQKIIFKKDNDGGTGGWGMQLLQKTDGTFNGSVVTTNPSTAGIDTPSVTISVNTWHQLVVVWTSGVNIKIYVDGVESGTTASTSTVLRTSNQPSTIGFGLVTNLDGYFNGSIDETRIYNRALTPSEVEGLYNFAPGPVGYWNMEENQGTSANDKSGNGNTGTWTGTGSHWKPGKYGSSGIFNGSDDYIALPDEFRASDTAGTVEGWFKINQWTASRATIFSWGSTNAVAAHTWNIRINNSDDSSAPSDGNAYLTIRFVGNGVTNQDLVGSTLISRNNWYHFSVTGDGSTYKMYINGIPQTLTAVGDAGANSGRWIGAATAPSGTNKARLGDAFFQNAEQAWINGLLDDVRYYNYPRTQKQIISDMNAGHPAVGSPVGSAIGHWKFDEGADNTCSGGTNDVCNSGSGGSALDGAQSGMAVPATATSGWTQSGKFGKGLVFDDSNDYINMGDKSALEGMPELTISAWVKRASTASQDVVVSKEDFNVAGQRSYQIRIESNAAGGAANTIRFDVFTTGSSAAINSTQTITDTNWHHIAATYDGATTKIYLDGKLDPTTGSVVGNVASGTDPFTIGINADLVSSPFNGSIDEVKVYSYALTADEVKLDMNRGSAQILGALSDNSSYQKQAANQEYCIPGDTTSCAAPVGRWDFEEGTGNTVNDTSGNANTGTWNGTLGSQWTTGKIGNAGNFNGSDDYVDVGDPSSGVLDFGTGDFTLSAWFKTSTTGVFQDILDKRITSVGYFLGVKDDNKIHIFAASLTGAIEPVSNSTVTDGKWHHAVGVFDRDGNASIYLDGKLDGTPVAMSGVGTVSSTGKAVIGYRDPALPSSWTYFNGQIDQVRIYNYVRTPAQIAWDYNRGAPVGHWKFNECQGTIAHDSSLNANHGTIIPGASGTYTSVGTCAASSASTMWYNGRSGKYNSSLAFDGTDDYVQVADSSSLSLGGGSVSMFAWVKGSSMSSTQTIIRKKNTDYVLATLGSKVWCELSNQSFVTNAGSNMSDGNWYFVGCTFDGTTLRSYLNGVEQGSDNTGTFGADSNGVLNIGTLGTSSQFFNGTIDDVRIYNYALTPTQVKLLYNGGAVRFGPSTGTP